MRNIRLILQYDGTNYNGWQVQPHQPTVQGHLEQAVQLITGVWTRVNGAGRTDAKVHALAQVVSFNTESSIPAEKLVPALNSVLPRDIRVTDAKEMGPHFHARHSARGKTYRYCIDRSKQYNVFYRNMMYHYPYPLDLDLMQEGADIMTGTHNYRGFASAHSSVQDYVRTITSIEFQEQGETLSISFTADGFLYNMVRISVGTLLEIGKGKLKTKVVEKILSTGDRRLAGPTVPGHGLYLVKVLYDQ